MAKVSTLEHRTHPKHTALTKPSGGQFHINEWTILGAPCSLIKELVEKLSILLRKDELRCGYLDMLHQEEDNKSSLSTIFEDKLSYIQWSTAKKIHERHYRKLFADIDILFVNGNHYKGQKQIVIIHEKKKESLSRKIDRLNNVKIVAENDTETFDFIKERISNDSTVLKKIDIAQIANIIINHYKKNVPPIHGLVLAGGKSLRMGENKAQINYHGKPQSEYEADLLSEYCDKVFISSTDESEHLEYPKIKDTFLGLGPYGGILSAFRYDPNVAWLTLACDLPYLNKETLSQLVSSRNPQKLATCFYNPETDFPEPLITIWEPRAYAILLDFLSQGYSCPRKVLINSDIEMIKITNNEKLKNSNTPIEQAEAKSYISNLGKSI